MSGYCSIERLLARQLIPLTADLDEALAKHIIDGLCSLQAWRPSPFQLPVYSPRPVNYFPRLSATQ